MATINLQGRRILVTGAARGLGFAFAQAAVTAGARVAIADILEERGRAAAGEIGAEYFALDLANPGSIASCASRNGRVCTI